MARPCGPCQDERRNELDRRLLEMDLTGETYRSISQDCPYSEDALRRHKTNHIIADVGGVRDAMIQAREAALEEARPRELETVRDGVVAEAKEGMAARLETCATFLDQLQAVRDKAANLLDQAEASDDLRAAGTFLKELREQIRLMAELEGRIASQPQITLITSPAWGDVRSLVINALEPYPEAREAVVHAIRGR